MVMTKRNLLRYFRLPNLLVFSTIQPVMFVLLFVYVWGGAMDRILPPTVPYVDFLMPGIFVQTAIFAALQTGVGLADDLQKGLIDRFRSLPMVRSAVLAGRTAAERFLLAWRGEVAEKAAKAIDTYWICTAEHGLNASTFTARVVASTGADCGAALSSAVGALSGPLHGGAPARVLPMLDAVAELGDAEKWVSGALARGERIMGFGHRVYRAEDPRSRVLKQTANELGSPRVAVAEELEQVAHEAIAKKHPSHSWTNVEYWSAIVLDVADVPPAMAPAMFACSRTAGWSAHVLEQKRLGVLIRPSARYVGPAPRSLQSV